MSCSGRTARRALTALAVLVTGLIAAPAPASAASDQDFAVGSADFQRAQDIAQAHWGTVPCQGNVTFTWQGLEPLTNARATWSNPTDPWANAGANFDCTVAFNTLTQYDFPMLCTVMAHELGHLLGHAHAAEDGVLMSAIYSSPLPECGGSTTPASESDQAAESDPIAWSVSESQARKKKAAKKVVKKKSAKRKRCIVRFKAGKRVKRCVALKKHSTRKARTASVRRRVHHYVTH